MGSCGNLVVGLTYYELFRYIPNYGYVISLSNHPLRAAYYIKGNPDIGLVWADLTNIPESGYDVSMSSSISYVGFNWNTSTISYYYFGQPNIPPTYHRLVMLISPYVQSSSTELKGNIMTMFIINKTLFTKIRHEVNYCNSDAITDLSEAVKNYIIEVRGDDVEPTDPEPQPEISGLLGTAVDRETTRKYGDEYTPNARPQAYRKRYYSIQQGGYVEI